VDGVGTILAVAASVLYSLIRLFLDVAATSRQEQTKLQAEVLVLRRQVQVLERQIKRVQWSPADRMILAALRERLPRTAWSALLVRPETVLGWHRDLVRRKWAAYVLVFMHLGTHRVLATTCTSEPNGEWVTQQARNLAWQLDEEGIELTILLHDRDRKFTGSFDRVVALGGSKVVLTPLMAPKANAHAERWIGSCRRECLDWMLIASEGHLRRVLRKYRDHYNDERPHRSRDLRPLSGRGDPVSVAAGDTINRFVRLGGLLSHYQLEMRAA
jgi:transposase InsO family protein